MSCNCKLSKPVYITGKPLLPKINPKPVYITGKPLLPKINPKPSIPVGKRLPTLKEKEYPLIQFYHGFFKRE